jgi:hypothetical protein
MKQIMLKNVKLQEITIESNGNRFILVFRWMDSADCFYLDLLTSDRQYLIMNLRLNVGIDLFSAYRHLVGFPYCYIFVYDTYGQHSNIEQSQISKRWILLYGDE